MTEMDPRDRGMDRLLRRSLGAPIPSLPAAFDQRIIRELRRRPRGLNRYSTAMLAGYGLVSAVTSATIMRGQGLEWGVIALMILAPLAMVAAVPLARRATSRTPFPT